VSIDGPVASSVTRIGSVDLTAIASHKEMHFTLAHRGRRVRCLIARYVAWHCGRIGVVAVSTGGIIEG